jgi:Tfp pilus assembly protein PilX
MNISISARKNRTRTLHRRRGMVLIIFLVCLAVAAAMIAATARIALTAHRATQTVSSSAQARLLAESGGERAAAKLAADAAYSGETWTVPAAELGGQDAGVVRIQVKPAAGEEKRRTIAIQADFPDDPVNYARQEKEIIVDLP